MHFFFQVKSNSLPYTIHLSLNWKKKNRFFCVATLCLWRMHETSGVFKNILNSLNNSSDTEFIMKKDKRIRVITKSWYIRYTGHCTKPKFIGSILDGTNAYHYWDLMRLLKYDWFKQNQKSFNKSNTVDLG